MSPLIGLNPNQGWGSCSEGALRRGASGWAQRGVRALNPKPSADAGFRVAGKHTRLLLGFKV